MVSVFLFVLQGASLQTNPSPPRPPPSSGDSGAWVVVGFCWTFECDKQASVTWEILHVECARFPGASLVGQEVCNDFLPAKK